MTGALFNLFVFHSSYSCLLIQMWKRGGLCLFLYYLAKYLLLAYMILMLSLVRLELQAEYEIEGKSLSCIREQHVRERVTSAILWEKVVF